MEKIKTGIDNRVFELKRPREAIDGLEILLERMTESPSLGEKSRKEVAAVREWSNRLAAIILGKDESSGDKAFQGYIEGLKHLLKNDTLWRELGVFLSEEEKNRESAEQFLSDPDSYLGPVSKEVKESEIARAKKKLEGTPVAEAKNKLEEYIADFERLYLLQKESLSAGKAN